MRCRSSPFPPSKCISLPHRLKKVMDFKRKIVIQEEIESKAKEAANLAKGIKLESGGDLLHEKHDEDIVV